MFFTKLLSFVALISAAKGMSYHDNEIHFNNDISDPGRYAIYRSGPAFTIEQHRVTNGQDPDNHIFDGQHYTNLVFSVGRKGSSDVADWWSARVPEKKNSFGHYSDGLNFAFGGKLSFNIVVDGVPDTLVINNFFMGQGHAGFSNNWWIGGPTCDLIDVGVIQCQAFDKGGSFEGHQWWVVLRRRGLSAAVDEVLVQDMIRLNYPQ